MSKGFTLIETLVALCAISICTLLLIPVLQIAIRMTYPLSNTEDILGIMRMRYILSQSTKKQINEAMFSFRYHDEDWTLSFHHQNIVKEPGYEIMLLHIKNANFRYENACFYLTYQKEEQYHEKEVLLTCE